VRLWGTAAGEQCLRLSERFFILNCVYAHSMRTINAGKLFTVVRSIAMFQKNILSTDCIENVQRQFTTKLPGLESMSYTDLLNCLGLITLELRIDVRLSKLS